MKPILRKISLLDRDGLLEFERRNQSYFERFVPPRPAGFLSEAGMGLAIGKLLGEMGLGQGCYYLMWLGDEIIGRFNFVQLEQRKLETGYRISEEFCGRGFASLGLELAILAAQTELGVSEVFAQTTPSNIGSIRVMEKCGFLQVGTIRRVAILNGENVDLLQFLRIL